MSVSTAKLRHAAEQGLSIALALTTTLWLVGVGLFAVPSAYALSNEAVVTDVTGNNPRIAENGESERVFLGINAARSDSTDIVQLNAVRARFNSDLAAEEAVLANIETVRVYQDSSLSGTNGVFDENDALLSSVTRDTGGSGKFSGLTTSTSGANILAGATSIDLDGGANLSAGDEVKIGTGVTAEIRNTATVVTDDDLIDDGCTANVGGVDLDCITVTATTYAHAVGTVVEGVNAEVSTGTAGFQVYGTETPVEVGVFGNTTVGSDLGFDIAKTDSGSDAGDDLFVVILTKGGAANQTVKAKVFTGDVEYLNNSGTPATITPAVSTGSGTTAGESKSVTFGADGVAPIITKIESFDTDNDGIVNRFKVYFNESMASTVTSSANFQDTNGGTNSRINALDASSTDLELGAITWQTTTVLNDTAQIDVTNTGAYTSAANSTGDSWTVVYNQGSSNDIKDATGENLLDASVATADKARPYFVDAELKDTDGDSKVDELGVIFSESLAATSTAAGFDLKNTSISGSPSYALGSVIGFKKSTISGSNDNDTIRIAVTENAAADVSDGFTLTYTAGSTIEDPSGNEAQSRSGVVPTKAINPVIVSVEFKDIGTGAGVANDGYIDTVEVTFNVTPIETTGDLAGSFSLSNGYALLANSESIAAKVLTLEVTQKTVYDSAVVPDLTYDDDGTDPCIVSSGSDCTLNQLLTVASSDASETDKARPALVSATLYETTANDIWETGETLQLRYSEPIDPATLDSSWNVSSATGGTFSNDFWLTNSSQVQLVDNVVPDSGTVSVSGDVVILTATVNAAAALTSTDQAAHKLNEAKDAAANSALPELPTSGGSLTGIAVSLDVTPTSAPTVTKISTWDENGNGIIDALVLYLSGLADSATVAAADFGASKGANFTNGEAATSTISAPADLSILSAATMGGGNDSRVVLRFAEANEDTGNHPQLKYVQGGLADLAGNKVASFNQNTSDNAKFMTGTITNPALDEADPVVVLKKLLDRNANGMVDQLVIVFSETMIATNTSSSGWSVANHTIASAGAYSNNVDYQSSTFAVTNAVYKVDVTELSPESSSMPGVSYASSGVFKDLQSRLLGDVAVGGEMSDVAFVPGAGPVVDGDLIQADGMTVYIVKLIGSKSFIRHIVNGGVFDFYGHLNFAAVKNVDSLSAYTMSAWVRLVMTTDPVTWRIYEVNDDASKHWITCSPDPDDCAAAWLAAGGDPDGVYTINQAEMDFYSVGSSVVLGL